MNDSLRERWQRVAGCAHKQVLVPMPRLWNENREKQARKIDEALTAMRASWDDLERAVRFASNGGAESALDLSLERLTTKQCERLDSLMSGRWTCQRKIAAETRAVFELKRAAEQREERYRQWRAENPEEAARAKKEIVARIIEALR